MGCESIAPVSSLVRPPAHPGSVGPVAGAMLVEMTVAELRCSTVMEVVSGLPVLGWPTDTGVTRFRKPICKPDAAERCETGKTMPT
jgi:hypothetical protein